MSELLRVGVLFGGRSSEREVSLASGRQVYNNLDRTRYIGIALFMDGGGRVWQVPEKLVIQNTCADLEARLGADGTRVPWEDLPERVDVVFIALHGKYGDDGCVQGALELVGMPYTGSGVLGCAISLDKPMAHALLAASGFDVPRSIVVPDRSWRDDPDAWTGRILDAVGLPLVVLPAREGSSLGVSVVREPETALGEALTAAFAYDDRAVVEEFLDALEFSVIVVGNDAPEAFLPTETTTVNAFMTYDDKYMPGRSQKITPARVDDATLTRIRRTAEHAYRALGFLGYGRLDGFLMPDGRILFTDPNSTSGMSPSSYMFHQAAEAGLSAIALIDRILRLALEAHATKTGPL
jgi:D-alanine-D-alanine ligase